MAHAENTQKASGAQRQPWQAGFTPPPILKSAVVKSQRKTQSASPLAPQIPRPVSGLVGGFTVWEIIIVLLIVGLVTGVMLANFRFGGRRIRLELQAQNVALQLRRVQNLAAATKEFFIVEEGSRVKPFGYGAFFNIAADGSNTVFTLFADLNDSKTYDSSREKFEDMVLGSDMRITALSYSRLTVVFIPPQPQIKFFDDQSERSVATVAITLSLISDPSIQKRITVHQSGEISID